MKVSLSKAQILERCRSRGGLEPLRSDCAIEFTDGIDVDAMLIAGLRSRYLEMLDTAPLRYLSPETVTPTSVTAVDGGVRIALPADVRRVVSVCLGSWIHPVEVQPAAMANAVVSRQGNIYRAATSLFPVAVDVGDGHILAWPSGAIQTVKAVVDYGEDLYVLDDSGLEMLVNQILSFENM